MKKCTLLAVVLLATTAAFAQNTKYQGEISAGYGIGIGNGDLKQDRIMLETVHGIMIGDHFYAGIGVGFQFYMGFYGFPVRDKSVEYIDHRYMFAPLFVNVKGYLSNDKFSPYISFDAGYGISVVPDGADYNTAQKDNGFYYSPALGFRIKSEGSSRAFTLAMAYQSQEIKKESKPFQALAFKIGFTF